MRRGIIFILILILSIPIYAQESTKITYTQEQDTLIRQRFIDRYEHVFMTKVPTRHMFKIGTSQYYQTFPIPLSEDKFLNNNSLMLGYEFKFLPSFSIALAGHIPYYGLDVPVKAAWMNSVLDAQLRWFMDMKKRIRTGKSANNFSGNYIALNYTRPGTIQNLSTVGVKVGFQRRFLSHGFMDFAVALQQEGPFFYYGFGQNWSFSSQASFGFAFGDWKRSAKAPLCDVLLCDQEISSQWKIRLPELAFGYYLNRIRLGVGFEQKISSSPFTLNFQYELGLNRGFDYVKYADKEGLNYFKTFSLVNSKEISHTLTFQPRYYVFHNRQKMAGRGGNGLSGAYTGINTEYIFYNGRHNFANISRLTKRRDHVLRTGLLLGFQQRLFRHGYVDLATSYNYQTILNTSGNSFAIRANLGVGLAF